MKTQGTDINLNQFLNTKYSLAAIAGIVTAIICSWVVLHEINRPQHESRQSSHERTVAAIPQYVIKSADLFAPSVLSILK
jgi:hypothetical protein